MSGVHSLEALEAEAEAALAPPADSSADSDFADSFASRASKWCTLRVGGQPRLRSWGLPWQHGDCGVGLQEREAPGLVGRALLPGLGQMAFQPEHQLLFGSDGSLKLACVGCRRLLCRCLRHAPSWRLAPCLTLCPCSHHSSDDDLASEKRSSKLKIDAAS